jgi:hypothetical protein
MNHKRSIIAVPVLAVTAVVIGSAEATAADAPERPDSAALMPDPGPPNYPSYDIATPTTGTSVDDTASEALQASASALGGASLALAGVWVYRRRRIHST